MLEEIRVPSFLNFSIFSKTCFLISSLSTTTSIIQSTSAILCKSSSKFPVVILITKSLLYIGEGLFFKVLFKASFTMEFLIVLSCFCSSVKSKGTISKSKTSTPIFAKWQAIRDPIIPEPTTATLLMCLFIFIYNFVYLF